jgi:hypothetical protein
MRFGRAWDGCGVVRMASDRTSNARQAGPGKQRNRSATVHHSAPRREAVVHDPLGVDAGDDVQQEAAKVEAKSLPERGSQVSGHLQNSSGGTRNLKVIWHVYVCLCALCEPAFYWGNSLFEYELLCARVCGALLRACIHARQVPRSSRWHPAPACAACRATCLSRARRQRTPASPRPKSHPRPRPSGRRPNPCLPGGSGRAPPRRLRTRSPAA